MTTEALLDALPARLAERCRPLNARPVAAAGRWVLLWAHHALRDHDNPTLDVALHLGRQLGLPVLVYQGLGGGHRYDADRHHAFILQGARDYHDALAQRGIRHVTHLPGWTPGPGLAALLPQAAALVCEDFPAPPLAGWTRRWAQRSDALCVAVDAACMVPMAACTQRFERAYAYRQTMAPRFRLELDQPLPTAPPAVPWPDSVALPSAGIDWGSLDLQAALAACPIDHSLPPVVDSVGGSRAGYARWNRFKAQGLARYHLLRNDAAVAPPLGVSRMSPYLHYGMVSPWRLAREAAALGGPGADKFIDELWVWRELAWQWCAQVGDPESIAAIPEWARDSLSAQAAEPRPALDDEALHRGRSGEPLWDLAQTSLLRHGELHNNLRMSWGKALVGWSHSPGQAMRRLRALNHRLALDGNDPASYGGLWWCLGLFDRPFDPPRPVFGRLRTRPLAQHARRLDLPKYAARVQRGAASLPRVAVIGAGLAGAAAAQALIDQGYPVTVLDKSRGVGGRLSTRRSEVGPFDHGAQFLRAHDPRFRRQVARWADSGLLARWAPHCADASSLRDAWVAVPTMNSLVKPMLDGARLQLGTAVQRLQREAGVWRLLDADGHSLAEAEQLILSAPAPQSQALLADVAPGLAARLDEVRYAPCWAAMLEGDAELAIDCLRDHGPIAWAAADASRPGRPSGRRWVVHASAEWSRTHLEDDAEAIGAALAAALAEAVGSTLRVVSVHRWRFALVEQALGVEHLAAPDLGLRIAGDFCLGGRLEAAWLSGQAAAGCLMREIALERQASR